MKFLQIVTLVVLFFLSLAVLAQASEDTTYESCQILNLKEAKTITLENYRHLNINPIRIQNDKVSFVLKHVNRLFYVNNMKVGQSFKLPEYNFVVTQIENNKVKVCLQKIEQTKIVIDKQPIVDNREAQNTKTQDGENNIDNKEDNKELKLDFEKQNPERKKSTKKLLQEAISTSFSQRYNTLFF